MSAITAWSNMSATARIAMIYEGTNGIQALDLVGRKLPAHAGRYLRSFFHPVSEFIEARKDHPVMGPLVQPLAKAFGALAACDGAYRSGGDARSGGSGRGGDRISAPVRAGGARLHVGAQRGDRGRRS